MAMRNPYNYSKPKGFVATQTPIKEKEVETNKQNGSKADDYLVHKVMSAKPEELTLMLYEGMIKFLKQGEYAIGEKNYEKRNASLQRAQAIIDELSSTLDMQYEVSMGLRSLYDFMTLRLVDSNIHNDKVALLEVIDLATEMKDTWKQAMSMVK